MRQMDTGSSPNFGDVSAVFRGDHVKDTVLIAPMDTGLYEKHCNNTSGPRPGQKVNCQAWEPTTVGTLDYHDHLIIPNLKYFLDSSATDSEVYTAAQHLFERSAFAGDYTSIADLLDEQMHYWESNILANPRLDGDVKLLIGSFFTLFGTDEGKKLQQVADQFAWPLFWAYGSAGGHGQGSQTPGNERFFDPANVHTNATVPQDAASKFQQLWSQVESARASGASSTQLTQFWSTFRDQQLRVAPITAMACADVHGCVATDVITGDCICQSGSVVV
jgi:hypothetical protein